MSDQSTSGAPLSGIPAWLKACVLFSLVCAAVLIATYFFHFSGGLADDQGVWGQFGDYVGGILNPLFALTALFALLYTIVLQSRELRASTEQLRSSAAALAAQNEVLTRQSFEATFFRLLALLNSVIQDLHVTLGPIDTPNLESGDFENRRCLEILYKILADAHRSRVAGGGYSEPLEQALSAEYDRFYERYGHLVGHYFRTIYNVIKFVDRSLLHEENKKFYTNLVRAQLSRYELGLLFYNCVSNYGRVKFLPLVRRYELLKHLEPDVLVDSEYRGLLDSL